MRGGARQCKRSSEVVHKEHRSRGKKNRITMQEKKMQQHEKNSVVA
jgi:hypothetical protein